MAAIDKTYGNKAQFVELFNWLKTNIPELSTWLTYGDISEVEKFADDKIFNISNLPVWVDMFVLANCEVEWFSTQIATDQHSWLLEDKSKTIAEHIAAYAEEDHQDSLEEYAKQIEKFGEPDLDEDEDLGAYNLFLEWRSQGYPVKSKCLEILEKAQLNLLQQKD